MGGGNSKPSSSPGPSHADLKREKAAREQEKCAREKLEKQLADMQKEAARVMEDNKQKTDALQGILEGLRQQMQQEQVDRTQLVSESKLIADTLERERLEAQAVANARAEEIARQQERFYQLQQETLEAQKTIMEKENDLRCYPIPVYMRRFKHGHVNIAITGASGVGKSSLLNALRRLKSTDPNFARVGDTETTMEPTPYNCPVRTGLFTQIRDLSGWFRNAVGMDSPTKEDPFEAGDRVIVQDMNGSLNGMEVEVVQSEGERVLVKYDDGRLILVKPENLSGKLQNCILWDLPGAGTPQFPQKTYIQLMGIRHFDLVALLTAERFTEAEALLMKELKHWNVPFVAVRTKIDHAIQAAIALKEEELEDELPEHLKMELSVSKVSEIKMALTEKHALNNAYAISTLPKLRKQFDFLTLEKDMHTAVKHQRGVSLEQECPICLDDYSDYGGSAGERLAAHPCGHTVCACCWQRMDSICPICRVAVTAPVAAPQGASASASVGASASASAGGYIQVPP